ncbi:MAG: Rne/Rng family ribonuclease [Hyphomicrobiaceae bacterium]|nr:Rne/Rng family ribonuclease [Hyphomicrobiaceae bacterium]
MSHNKMLIDATHPEETRVVVLRSGRVEEFDYESAARKLLRGNIYLAKVTRVEPSLQAAFVEYGGNRHGFLAFNEIHPDYYQIPMADRQALLDEEAAAEAREEAEVDAHAERLAKRQRGRDGGRNDRGRRSRPARIPGDGEQPRIFDAPASAHDDHGHEGHGHEGHDHEHGSDDHAHDHDHTAESDTPEAPGPHTLAERAHDSDDVLKEDLPPSAEGESEHEDDDEAGDEPAAEDDRDDNDTDDEDNDDEDDGDEAGEIVSAGEASDAGQDEAGEDTEEGNIEVVAPAAKGPEGDVETVEQVGAEDALEELPSRPRRRPRSYKIQEVIKRRQVILVQVVKEERGNKGAALTTYLSLAGRYTVLMPNTARGGGISRKITQPQDRKRLKAIAQDLEVPEGMGLIIRTAGAARTQQEIKRDFEYLLRLWESVRDLTLQSTAPNLVYEEGNLIKRSIRDLYNKDVDEIIVAGEEAHHDARDFMRMLMPSHAKNVLQHTEPEPLFTRFGIERQLNAMFSPYVTLRSGGYLVINQTEALVAIDVNSGKSTREFSIEETALNTNLEASDEIARQLKLRDLAGLVVIDYIDMEEKRNNRAVERRLKDALRFDRARIQLGRISHFGLMEMSRQRMRTGVLEGSTSQCPHCQGTGIIRSTESVALAVLRGLEDALMAGARTSLIATTTATVALYLLNNKRPYINEMEARHGLTITITASEKLQGANFTIEKGHAAAVPPAARRSTRSAAVNMDWGFEGEDEAEDDVVEGEEVVRSAEPRNGRGNGHEARDDGENREEGGRKRRRRRRGRRGERDGENGARQQFDRGGDTQRDDEDGGVEVVGEADDDGIEEIDVEAGGRDGDEAGGEERTAEGGARGEESREGRRRRRGRRGGRRGRDRGERGEARAANDDTRDEAAEGFDSEDAPAAMTAVTGDARADLAEGVDQDSNEDGAGDEPAARPAREPRGRGRNGGRTNGIPAAASEDIQALPVETYVPASQGAEVPSMPEPAVEAAAEPSAPAAMAAAPAPRARRSTTSSEPKLERVVVRPDEAAAEEAEPVSDEAGTTAVRRGWWQRR